MTCLRKTGSRIGRRHEPRIVDAGRRASADQVAGVPQEVLRPSNIMLFPPFRLVFELWDKYHSGVMR